MTHRHLLLATSIVLGAIASCVNEPGATVCPTGVVCPADTTCAAAQPVCITGTCGNGRVDPAEACDDGNIIAGDGCSPNCTNEMCGNGVTEPGEICDDGNTTNGDGCSADCLSREECGNGIVDVKKGGTDAERCDDGNTVAGDGCRADCKEREFCNNGFVDPGEVCDDGMPVGGPCSPDCMSGLGCGNGFLDPGEQCDDGNTIDTDDCRFPSCKIAVCGDGVNNTGGPVLIEQCDAGTNGTPVESASCNIDCTNRVCGDGKVNQTAGEQCDTGNAGVDAANCDMGAAPDGCTVPVCGDNYVNAAANEQCDPGTPGANVASCNSDCTMPACGDGRVNNAYIPPGATLPEGCDDGGTTPGDGCSALCQIESCGNGVTETVNGEQCDDGNQNDLDACRNNCQMPRCGDGVHSNMGGGEICDTNGMDSMTCDSDCTMPMCGDGHVNKQFTPPGAPGPEECEDGNTTNGDGCNSTCRLEPFALAIAKAGSGTGLVQSNEAPTPRIDCGSDCSEIYLANTPVTLTATPAMNATFNGWSGGGCSGTGQCMIVMNMSRNVTATFEANTLTVTKLGTGNGNVSGTGINCGNMGTDCTETYNVGTMVMLTAQPTSDSVFGGWGGAAASCGTNLMCSVTMNAASSATATFTLNVFQLTVNKHASSTGTGTLVSSPQGMPSGINCGPSCTTESAGFTANTLVTIVPTPAADSDFIGWSGDCSGTGSCAVTMSTGKTVTAQFNKKPATLTVTTSSGGSVTTVMGSTGINCPGDCSETYPNGTMVNLQANPSNGKAFTGWGGACSGTALTCSVTMDAAKTVSATFETNRLSINKAGGGSGTVTGPSNGFGGNGINCGGNCVEDYNHNAMPTLTATAGNNDIFTGWSVPGSGSNCGTNPTCQVTMVGPQTVTATFEDASTLTVNVIGNGNVTGPGIDCPDGGDCTQAFVDGTTGVVLTATPDVGHTLSMWTGCDSPSGNTCTMDMNSNKTVTATFVPLQFTLGVTVGGTGTATVTSVPVGISCTSGNTCMADFNYDTMVQLSVTTSNTFAGWTGDCASCMMMTTCTVTMTTDRNCTATINLP